MNRINNTYYSLHRDKLNADQRERYSSSKFKVYYLYRITNTINGMYYLGKHCAMSEGSMNRYLGSGTIITKAVKKYGAAAFKKEIISYHKDPEELSKAERSLITTAVLNDPMCYNILLGGEGIISQPDVTREAISRSARSTRGERSAYRIYNEYIKQQKQLRKNKMIRAQRAIERAAKRKAKSREEYRAYYKANKSYYRAYYQTNKAIKKEYAKRWYSNRCMRLATQEQSK